MFMEDTSISPQQISQETLCEITTAKNSNDNQEL